MDPQAVNTQETEQQKDVRLNKDLAAFSYVWIMSVIIYSLRKDSAFIRYHSKQAMVLFFASIFVYMLPWVGSYLLYIVVAGMLYGFITAAQGNRGDVPFAGKIAKGEYTWAGSTQIMKSSYTSFIGLFRRMKPPHKDQPLKPEHIPAPSHP